jgi:hypothetical protein
MQSQDAEQSKYGIFNIFIIYHGAILAPDYKSRPTISEEWF